MFTPHAPLNRVPSGCSTGVECLFLFHWGSMLHAPCAMLAIPLGFGNSLSRYPIKLHQLTLRVELFYFVCRMKLVLRLDIGRWSRILRVWKIVKNRDLTPDDFQPLASLSIRN